MSLAQTPWSPFSSLSINFFVLISEARCSVGLIIPNGQRVFGLPYPEILLIRSFPTGAWRPLMQPLLLLLFSCHHFSRLPTNVAGRQKTPSRQRVSVYLCLHFDPFVFVLILPVLRTFAATFARFPSLLASEFVISFLIFPLT